MPCTRYCLRNTLVAKRYLDQQTYYDRVTGLANRRRFDEFLAETWQRAQQTRTSVALILADVDRFKLVNDTWGHATGDAVLRCVAQALAAALHRAEDVAARFGGEEFAVDRKSTRLNSSH